MFNNNKSTSSFYRMKEMNFYLSKYLNDQDFDQQVNFCTYHVRASVDTVGPYSGLSLNLHIFFVYGSSDFAGESTNLQMLD